MLKLFTPTKLAPSLSAAQQPEPGAWTPTLTTAATPSSGHPSSHPKDLNHRLSPVETACFSWQRKQGLTLPKNRTTNLI